MARIFYRVKVLQNPIVLSDDPNHERFAEPIERTHLIERVAFGLGEIFLDDFTVASAKQRLYQGCAQDGGQPATNVAREHTEPGETYFCADSRTVGEQPLKTEVCFAAESFLVTLFAVRLPSTAEKLCFKLMSGQSQIQSRCIK